MLLNACKRLRPRAFPFDRARPPVSDMCFDCTRAIVTGVITSFTKCNCRGAGLDMVPGDIAFKRCGIEFQFIVAFVFFCAISSLIFSLPNVITSDQQLCDHEGRHLHQPQSRPQFRASWSCACFIHLSPRQANLHWQILCNALNGVRLPSFPDHTVAVKCDDVSVQRALM